MKTALSYVVGLILALGICMSSFAQEAAEESSAPAESAVVEEAPAESTMPVEAQVVEETPVEVPAPAEPAVVEEAPAQAEVPPPPPLVIKPGIRLVVFMPEQIDVEWFWYYYTTESQYFVQGAVEKALVAEGFDVIDVAGQAMFQEEGDIKNVMNQGQAVKLAQKLGASHLVIGKANAISGGNSVAYGISVYRSSSDAMAKVVSIADGKVLSTEEASAKGGGQSQRMAAQEALKEVGDSLARKLAASANNLFKIPAQ